MPLLVGWDRQLTQKPPVTRVIYTKTVGRTPLNLGFVSLPSTGQGFARQRYLDKILQDSTRKRATLNIKETKYRGLPALMMTTRAINSGVVVDGKSLNFKEGNTTYIFQMRVSGDEPSEASQQEAEKGWQELINGVMHNSVKK